MSRLTKEIAFYRKYHRNPVNVALHIVGIPTILTTSLYSASALRVPGSTYLTAGVVGGLYYWQYYARLDPSLGFFVGAFVAFESLLFAKLTVTNPHYFASWTLWSIGWIAQFIGHGVFEGRAPALFDNLHQALVLAPFFAFLEVAAICGSKHAKQELSKIDGPQAKSQSPSPALVNPQIKQRVKRRV